jgi:[ribosomal protein S5]-alanine N-acetyltransferase
MAFDRAYLPVIRTKRLVLRAFRLEDITPEYVRWINDPETTKYLEVRHIPQTRERIEAFIESKLMDTLNTKHFGIFDEEGKRLVGTVSFPAINWNHLFADISFVIGHPEAQGKGYATEAVHGAAWYMFREIGLVKLWGGYYDGHAGSAKVFEKNGFTVEGRLRKKVVDYRGERVDHVLVGLLASEFSPKEGLLGSIPPEIK